VSHRPPHYELRPFSRVHASLVASWVRDDDELFWLAPRTLPPITSAKIIGWTARWGRPLLFWTPDWPEPIGYAELNDMPARAGELWIGHFIIAPPHRGQGLSREFLRLLLDQGFGPLRASRVALIVFPDNELAIRCYTSGGMVKSGWQRRTFEARSGVHKMMEMVIERADYEAANRRANGA
jgi:RimJ/RimL family protein N-acetyltransferase